MASGHPVVKRVRFEIDCQKGILAETTRRLKPASKTSIEEKKAAVDFVFALMHKEKALGSRVINGYVTCKLIPQIIKTNDKELAEHTLTWLKPPTEETEAVCNLVLNRIDLINVTGNPKYIDELHGYTGDQYGLPEYMRKGPLGFRAASLSISEAAEEAIVKLKGQ